MSKRKVEVRKWNLSTTAAHQVRDELAMIAAILGKVACDCVVEVLATPTTEWMTVYASSRARKGDS